MFHIYKRGVIKGGLELKRAYLMQGKRRADWAQVYDDNMWYIKKSGIPIINTADSSQEKFRTFCLVVERAFGNYAKERCHKLSLAEKWPHCTTP